jgi:putative transposase
VWLHFRFPLSFREVEELMLERGIVVSYETIRRWCGKFGQAYAKALRRRQPQSGDKWHLDEVFIKINGRLQYLWRAVDQNGMVLDILVQSRDKAAAMRFFRRLLKKIRTVPRVVVTDKLRSYGAAHREVMPSVEHRSHKGLNNRAENSHQPTRQRERAMKGFHNIGGAHSCPHSGASHPTSGPPPSDARIRLPSRDDRPLRNLGAHHRSGQPLHHGLSTAWNRAPPRRNTPSDTYPATT